MQHTQAHGQHLPCFEKMVDISASKVSAHRTVTGRIQRAFVEGIFGIHHIPYTLHGEHMAVTGIPGGHDTVKNIHAPANCFQNIGWGSNPHQISGLILRHMRGYCFNHLIHHFSWFAYRQTTDGIAVQIQFPNALHMIYTKVLEGAALIDAPQHLMGVQRIGQAVQPGHFRFAAFQPASCAGTGCFCIFIGGRIFHTLIKGHGNGRTQIGLDAHTLFWPHKDFVTVNMGSKGYAFLFDVAQLCQ